MTDLPSRSHSTQSVTRSSSGPAGWYCEIGGETHGPMDYRELRGLALDKKLLGHHQAWQDGSDKRQAASSIMGLIPHSKKRSAAPSSLPPASSDVSDQTPYATPKARTIADGPPGGLYLPHLTSTNFPLFLLVLICSGALSLAGWKMAKPDLSPAFYTLSGFGIVIWFAIALIYVHRAWEMMKMFGASMDGSKAVRFLFLPVFNALWSFVAIFGWSRLWNRSVKNHPGLQPATKVWRPMFFLFPILFLISQALVIMYVAIKEWPIDLMNQNHQIALGFLGSTLFVGLVCWFQISQSINFLARKKS